MIVNKKKKKCSSKGFKQFLFAISFQMILFVFYCNFSIFKVSRKKSSSMYDHNKQTDCTQYLHKFWKGEIQEVEEQKDFAKAYVTRTTTSYPFYWSTHKPELDSVRASSFEKGNYYETELSMRVIEAIQEEKKKGGEVIFLDVGSNIGWFSLLARSFGATNVYLFEPNPVNILRICESLTLNDWKNSVHIMQMGVGSNDEKKNLHQFTANNPGAFSFDEQRLSKFKNKMDKIVGEFHIKKLDTFAEEMGWFYNKQSIAFFKLDVEGYEHAVIDGAKKLLKSKLIQYIELEIRVRRGNKEVQPMLKILLESGYELYMHGRTRGPKNIVEKKYSSSADLTSDIIAGLFGENLLFRLKTR